MLRSIEAMSRKYLTLQDHAPNIEHCHSCRGSEGEPSQQVVCLLALTLLAKTELKIAVKDRYIFSVNGFTKALR